MPLTTRVRAQLARYLLTNRNDDLRRRIAILKLTPYPPGSHSLKTDAHWEALAEAFPDRFAFIYGSNESAVVYTFDARSNALFVEFAILSGVVVGRDD